MRLVGVEVRRLLARRLLWVMVALALAALAVVLIRTAANSHPPTAAEHAAARAQALAAAATPPAPAGQARRCDQDQTGGQIPAPAECVPVVQTPRTADFLPDHRFTFAKRIAGRLGAVGALLAVLGFVVGASFIGAEWSAGTMAGLLLWEPRRTRVVVAKTVALSLVLALVGAGLMASALAGNYGVAAWRGNLTGVTHGVLTSAVLAAARAVGLGVGAGTPGLAVAGFTRQTAAALGLGFAYFVGAELVLRTLWRGAGPWLLTSNVSAWLLRGIDLPPAPGCPQASACQGSVLHLSMAHGAVYLAALTALLLIASTIGFRRRDVT